MANRFKRIGIFGKYRDASVKSTVDTLRGFLEGQGCEVLLDDTTGDGIDGTRTDAATLERPLDLAIAVGGDGTMLNAARELARFETPLVGINLGRVGFLTDIPAERMIAEIEQLLLGEYFEEERIMLRVEVEHHGEIVHSAIGFNDIVLHKGATARLLDFPIYVNDKFVTDVRADGLICATPTGSTAYSLSAGGPICVPGISTILLVPICPHTLTNRPIILSDKANIKIGPVRLAAGSAHLSVDGHLQYTFRDDEIVRVRRARRVVRMVRPRGHNHFEALRTKLGWGDVF